MKKGSNIIVISSLLSLLLSIYLLILSGIALFNKDFAIQIANDIANLTDGMPSSALVRLYLFVMFILLAFFVSIFGYKKISKIRNNYSYYFENEKSLGPSIVFYIIFTFLFGVLFMVSIFSNNFNILIFIAFVLFAIIFLLLLLSAIMLTIEKNKKIKQQRNQFNSANILTTLNKEKTQNSNTNLNNK